MDGGLKDTAHFSLRFAPNLSLVSSVRRFVSDFYSQLLVNADATSQLAVATHELLDNAVVYSSDGDTNLRVGVLREGSRLRARIETVNRATKEHLELVRRAIDRLTAAKDPLEYFQTMMRETAKHLDGSGLGLARVRAESDMTIEYEIQGNELHLRATAIFQHAV